MRAAKFLIKRTATIYRHATQAGVSKIISVGSGSAYPDMPGDKAERDIFNGRCHESVEGYSFGKRALLLLQTNKEEADRRK